MSDIPGVRATPSVSRRDAIASIACGATIAALGSGLLPPAAAEAASARDNAPDGTIAPFRVAVPQAQIDDLKRRLAATRWPDHETVGDASQGVPLDSARRLVDYWHKRYDWRKFERKLNAFPQFRTRIDGLGIHFIHVKSPHADALPIILTHGWPGTVVEFLKAIGPLTNPTAHGGSSADAFHVVIPSQPGFGWSDKPPETGWNVVRTAKAWGVLMERLGYGRWVAQGGDWGSGVTHALGHIRPQGLVAAHVNWPLVIPAKPPENPTPEEKAALDAAARFLSDGAGYFAEQATRPQTIGYALADSAVGQATWIYEKFQAWTDNRGRVEDVLSTDEMLDDISTYWFTNSAASSARIYWENTRQGGGFDAGKIDLPMAATIFPKEIYRAPRTWAQERWSQLIYWNEVDRGGHFAAFEQPQLFAEELRLAFRSIRG